MFIRSCDWGVKAASAIAVMYCNGAFCTLFHFDLLTYGLITSWIAQEYFI